MRLGCLETTWRKGVWRHCKANCDRAALPYAGGKDANQGRVIQALQPFSGLDGFFHLVVIGLEILERLQPLIEIAS